MPKLSDVPKLYFLSLESEPSSVPVLAIDAASEAEAWHYLRHEMKVMRRATPSDAYALGAFGVPRVYAKPEYRDDGMQAELPLGGEVAHGQ